MKSVVVLLVTLLLVVALFRMVNGVPIVGLNEFLIKIESFSFDAQPFNDFVALFRSESDTSTYFFTPGVVLNPPTYVETVDPDGMVDVEMTPNPKNDQDFFDLVSLFFKKLGEFVTVTFKMIVAMFSVVGQSLDLILWMLGFTA